jgi:hypothetical protein
MNKATVVFVIGVVFLIMAVTNLGHCAVSARPNSLGVFQTYENPYTYMVGAPVHVELFEAKGHFYTNVEFKALGASMLNTVPILFCDDEQSAFADGQLRAVTYRIRATRSYQGIGCHEILPIQGGVIVIE